MIGICIDNSHTLRNALTIGKIYKLLKSYTDVYGVRVVHVKCDDGKVRKYKADRFIFKEVTE